MGEQGSRGALGLICTAMSHGSDEPQDRSLAQPISKGALERALVRTWRSELQLRAFTDREAARLIMTKLLYLHRRLHG
jgi:hypothetical protein